MEQNAVERTSMESFLFRFEQNQYQLTRGHCADESLSTQRMGKRRRQEEDRIEVWKAYLAAVVMLIFQQIIRSQDIKLISEIGSGPGYCLHFGRNEDRAIIVRVFNRSPIVRQVSEIKIDVVYLQLGQATGINGGSFGGTHVCPTLAAGVDNS
jgi:hypothetical protein